MQIHTVTNAQGAGEFTVSCESPRQRALVRMWNQIAAVRRRPLNGDFLDLAELHDIAARRTGLHDFGSDSYQEPLRKFAAALRETAGLHPFGRFFARQMILMGLTNRLRIEDEWKRRPEAHAIRIERPIFILGLPRTGTTHLYSMLAQDRAHRYLTNWEATQPVPPNSYWGRAQWARRLRSQFSLAFFDYLAPAYNVIYPLRVDGPEECGPLAMNEFAFPLFHEMFNIPGYIHWIDNYDFRDLLAYHRRQIQLLHLQRPGRRWLLKSPYLVAALPALLETYPDALVIQTHRDPLKVIPSVCSMWAAFRGISSGPLDAREIGRQVVETMRLDLSRCLAARNTLDPASFVDLRYADLAGDPLGAVGRIYAAAGLELDAETGRRMAAYISTTPRHKRGVHRYSLEQFGLETRQIRETFRDYYERFDVPMEQ